MLASIAYSGIGTFVLLKIVSLVFPLRATESDEILGLDPTQHGEDAYVHPGGTAVEIAPKPSPAIVRHPVSVPATS